MSNIIKHSDVVLATKQSHEGFRIGDYITDSHFEAFYRLESIETRRWGNSDHEVYVCKGVNPITLELDGNDRDMDIDELTRYYQVVDADVVKLRDIAHRVLNEGASIEDMQESSDTSLMALGNKQSLIALRQQIDESQRSVTLVKNYCHMMQTQVRNELQKKIDQVNGIVEKMGREIKRLDYVIQTIETYAGIKEEIITLQSGEPAPETEPIVIRQAVLFMDEEFALIDDDFDWEKIESFDKWLTEDGNYKILLPDAKSVVAIKPRRTDKKYCDDWWTNRIMNRPNHVTLFLIRNGENLYRLDSEHIYLEDRMFPNLDEYAKTLEKEQKDGWYRHNKENDNLASDHMRRRFTKVAFLLQGLLDRSDVFAPHNVKCSFLKMEGLNEQVKMDYELDTSHLLQDGRPSVTDWIKQTNAGIKEGSRILLVSCSDMNSEMFLRYYSDRYSVPDYPPLGVYTVKKNPKYNTEKDWQWREVYRRPYCIAYMPKQDSYSWTEGPHDRKIKSSICFREDGYDILNYDNLNIEELDYYLNNRLYRSQYYLYVRLLKTARSLVEKEYQQETDFINMLCGELIAESLWPKDGYTHDGIARIALQTVKDRLKWKRPISSKERETYYLVRRTLFSEAFRKKYFK